MKKINWVITCMMCVLIGMAGILCQKVSAETKTYTITIQNALEGHTYEAYQIFKGDFAEKNDKKLLSNITWGDGVANSDTFTESASVCASKLGKGEWKVSDFVDQLKLTVNTHSSGTMVGGNYKISGLTPGYYLVKDKDHSLTEKNDAYTDILMQVVGDVVAKPKADIPTSEKKVKDINTSVSASYSDYQDSADHEIGEKIPFQFTGTVADHYDSYKTYHYCFYDKQSAGLTLQKDSVKVFVDDVQIKSGYELVTDKGALPENVTFAVKFDDLKKMTQVKAKSKIKVTYEAILNENAIIGAEGNPNKMYLTYSNNPYDEKEYGKTPEDTVVVFTYRLLVTKVDDNKTALPGAEFQLQKKLSDGSLSTPYTITKDANGTRFYVKGLDDGTYVLTETVTPEGYNTVEPITFEVMAEHDVLSDAPKLTALSGSLNEGIIEMSANASTGSINIEVMNKEGVILPMTGGSGTVMIYLLGCILLASGLVLYVRKNKKAGQKEEADLEEG